MAPTENYNPDVYWSATADSYPMYPTVRHRKRFILGKLKRFGLKSSSSVFDFGCGEGTLLETIHETFSLPADNVGGCDVSENAVQIAQQRIASPHLYHSLFPVLPKKFDAMVCSEVIEHTRDFEDILLWMSDNLKSGGLMIVTTQAGRIHPSDRYTGHTQHFSMTQLRKLLQKLGLRRIRIRLWGWPLFTAQKYLTNVNFNHIQHSYLEGAMTRRKRCVFALAYALYFVHDIIPCGPQIYVTAKKP